MMFPFHKSRPKRPFLVTFLIILVLSFTTLGLFGLVYALRNWAFLLTLPLSVPVFYLALRSGFWGLVGVPLVWGLWVGRTWAWYATQVIGVVFALFYWLDRILFAQPSVIKERWQFAVGATVLGLVFVFVVLWLPRSRRFFAKYQSGNPSVG